VQSREGNCVTDAHQRRIDVVRAVPGLDIKDAGALRRYVSLPVPVPERRSIREVSALAVQDDIAALPLGGFAALFSYRDLVRAPATFDRLTLVWRNQSSAAPTTKSLSKPSPVSG
jgi:hypothetical protein